MIKKWWMEAIGYQVYIKSFKDSNGDGIGDLAGVYEKLGYLKELGISLIWLAPFCDSPMDDNGYDVRDFYKVNDNYGSIEELKKLIEKAHELEIKVIMDLVLNHTSDEHPWFIESRKSLDNKYRDYYIWQPPKYKNNLEVEPTNWASFFGGSAWNKDPITGEYYMKIFSNKMPDLNWKNPKLRQEMYEMAKWWLEFGIDGFRIDAASHLSRAPFIDSTISNDRYVGDWSKFSNLARTHDYLHEMKREVFRKYDMVTVGEVGGGASTKSGLKFASFDKGSLDMVFNFDHNWCIIDDENGRKTDVIGLKKVFSKWQAAMATRGWNPLYWLNHDQPRLMTQYGSLDYFKESGKMLATALYLMRGTPFIFQGEEIGMTNYPFKKIEEFRDVSTINPYNLELANNPDLDKEKLLLKYAKNSRDHARTPIQWDDTLNAGFTTNEPWIGINPNYKKINVKEQINDTNSIWHYYKKIFSLRKDLKYKELIIYGKYKIVDLENEDIYSYLRYNDSKEAVLVINSFRPFNTNFNLKPYLIKEQILSNYEISHIENDILTLKPYQSVVFVVKIDKKG